MKQIALLAYAAALLQTAADPEMDAFYVWQQHWSANVLTAVSNETATTLYPLASVIPDQGESALTAIPWETLSTFDHRLIPVFRIPMKSFQRPDLLHELAALTERLRKSMAPLPLDEIQFDLDCPERLLTRYAELVEAYRKQHPDLRLSITALPSHLDNRAFRQLAAASDGYILQLHGIEVPRHIDEPTELLNMQTARTALRQAEEIGLPYLVALPCYAYELNFAPETGSFLFLTAEKTARRADTIRRRSAARHTDLAALLNQITTLEHGQGVVWFRLPVEGDRLCLPRPTLAVIQAGSVPPNSVDCTILPLSATTFELELINRNTIAFHQVILSLEWPHPAGAYDLYQTINAENPGPGMLPAQLSAPIPPPGESIKLGWFQAAEKQRPTIGIRLK